MLCDCISYFFFFKQKTAYEMRISDWSSDVCSSDLIGIVAQAKDRLAGRAVGDGHPAVIVGDAVGRPAQPVFGAVLLDHREPALIDELIEPGRARRAGARLGAQPAFDLRLPEQIVEVDSGERKSVVSGQSASVRVNIGG